MVTSLSPAAFALKTNDAGSRPGKTPCDGRNGSRRFSAVVVLLGWIYLT